MLYKQKNEKLLCGIDELKEVIKRQNRQITSFKKSVEYDKQVKDVIYVLRVIQSSLTQRRSLYDAIEDSKDHYCNYSDPEKYKKHQYIESVYRILFKLEDIDIFML